MDNEQQSGRMIQAVHGLSKIDPDPQFEKALSAHLQKTHDQGSLLALYGRFAQGLSEFDIMMRRTIWRALCRSFGDSVKINDGVGFKHIETFEIGSSVFIGSQTYIQGRFDGHLKIGDHVWIGPQSYFDARDLEIEEYVGWGPGAKVLGSEHTAMPIDIPILKTDLQIKPVRIRAWADIGTNAIILPGITIGKGAIVGAGAVVTEDVAPFSIVAGVPARFLRWRADAKDNTNL